MTRRGIVFTGVFLAVSAAAVGAWLYLSEVRAEKKRISAREKIYRGMGIFSSGREDFVPLPRETPHRAGAALLGASLFSDKRLVKSSKRTCAACHPPLNGGVDGKIHLNRLTRSTKNAAFSSCYLADGSLDDLKDVVEYMISTPKLGFYSVTGAVARLRTDPKTVARFEANYKTGLTASNVVDSIVQYMRANVTVPGVFDRYLSGAKDALDVTQIRGFEVFKTASCASCHSGPALGGRAVYGGRKVTALRGAALRKRFLSDGSAQDVTTAFFRMPTADLSEQDRAALVAFVECL